MAVAWIAYLDLDEVREWFVPYRTQCFDWHWQRWRRGFDGPVYEGWHLEQRSSPTLSLLGISASLDRADGDKRPKMTIGEAEKALWDGMRTDCFRASGLNENGRRVEIPPLEWNDLKLILGRGDREELCFDFGRVAYRELLLPAASIRGLWREPVERTLQLPPTMSPTGDGYMPLFCAVQWIATEGGAVDFDPDDESIWRRAFDKLLGAIASEKVRVVGLREGARELVPGFHFAGCVVDFPYTEASLDMILSDTIYLRSCPYVDEVHWLKNFNDALVSRHRDHWTHLMVEKGDVRQRWPFTTTETTRTGAPGRPALSMHLIFDELERRAIAGKMLGAVGKESLELVEWLKVTHASNPRPTPKTVENQIRDRYRVLKAARNNPTGGISG